MAASASCSRSRPASVTVTAQERRSRGLRSRELAAALGIPYDKVMLAAFIPLAYTLGTDFEPAVRVPRAQVLHWERW
ncbi:hypothetical protein ACQPZ2_41695 [Nocardia pseudovaccinii]|uniref:hypothetical protein n=1 Tax=Nocardia pseudovaccinii TaxID=189540 RepID=UPI003D8EAB88